MNTVITIIINTRRMKSNFNNANEAFEYFKLMIQNVGTDFDDTKAMFNVLSLLILNILYR